MISAHLPAIQVVLPLLAAALCALIPWKRGAWAVAMLGSVGAFGAAVGLLRGVQEGAVVSYALGGWAAPWGIEYRIDAVNAFVLLIVAGIGVVVTPYALTSVEREIDEKRIPLFYSAWMLCLCGLLGIAITGGRLQRLRVPRNLVTVRLHADRDGLRSASVGVGVSLPDHGKCRRDVHRDRDRPDVRRDRHPEHGGISPFGCRRSGTSEPRRSRSRSSRSGSA